MTENVESLNEAASRAAQEGIFAVKDLDRRIRNKERKLG